MSITRNEIKILKTLKTPKGRKKENRYIAEGVRLLEESLRFDHLPKMILFSESELDDRLENLLVTMQKKSIRIEKISAKDLEAVADTKSPQGIIGIFEKRELKTSELSLRKPRKILWCENISDPGNVGTLLRSALAFEFEIIFVSGSTADIFSPKVVRSAMGAIFKLKIVKDTESEIFKLIDTQNYSLLAADVLGKPIRVISRKYNNKRVVLAIGSEAFGLSDTIKQKAAEKIRIEHEHEIESLNASVAGSILMNEFYKLEKGNK